MTTYNVQPGPYYNGKESINGVMMLNVESYDDALVLAADCPILEFGGNIEIR